ncbi:heterokaryon incompatibility protein-domain-containing protein [Fusarium oxysporum II5]|nr:heterokaryon incompatibility protein-domain-containing protein [Fusarium oxysporum II5]
MQVGQIHYIPRFQIIRCWDSEVIPAPAGCSYAALSYVWGDIEYPNPNDYSKFPQVVVDSIKVASKLGCHYLLVDRHCINQEDPDKKKQIQRMDEIYSQADFTIIDAAGINCTYGLAGVTPSCRPDQPQGYA